MLITSSTFSSFLYFAVEFPAVLLNTSTGEVESEFHTYVQPQEHPILSDFCTELTGITQVMGINTHTSGLSGAFYIISDSLISLSHRCKLKQGSPCRSVFPGSAAGCKTCSSIWAWSFPIYNRELLQLQLLKNCVLSSHGQVNVKFHQSRILMLPFIYHIDPP